MVANAQKLAALRGDMIGLNDIENPFTAWLETLKLMAMELAALTKITKTPPKLLGKGSTGAEIEAIIDQYLKLTPEDQTILFGSPLLPKGSLPPSMAGTFTEGPEAARMFNQMSMGGSMGGAGTVVNVNVTGSVTTERDLVAAITQGLYAQQASGTPVNYSTAY
jgi:hypothetical protein